MNSQIRRSVARCRGPGPRSGSRGSGRARRRRSRARGDPPLPALGDLGRIGGVSLVERALAQRERDVAAVADQVDEARLGQRRARSAASPACSAASCRPSAACPAARRRARRRRGSRRRRSAAGARLSARAELVRVEAEVAPARGAGDRRGSAVAGCVAAACARLDQLGDEVGLGRDRRARGGRRASSAAASFPERLTPTTNGAGGRCSARAHPAAEPRRHARSDGASRAVAGRHVLGVRAARSRGRRRSRSRARQQRPGDRLEQLAVGSGPCSRASG